MVKMGLASALGAVFAVVALMSVFLSWMTTTGSIFGFTTDITGWELFNEEGISEVFDYYILPLIVLGLAAISALIFLFAPKGNVTALLTVVFGLLIVLFAFLTYYQFGVLLDDTLGALKPELKMSFGLILVMAAGVGTVVCGAVARK